MRFNATTSLPPFVGNTIRGAFGHALSRYCCEWESPHCDDCANASSCAYGAMFKVQSSESIPNPYVISALYPGAERYEPGDTLDFYITLFGFACDFESSVLQAAKSMCRGKLHGSELVGMEREYSREWSDCGAETIAPCDALIVRFITPTEIRNSGKAVSDISFAVLVDSLFGRIAGIVDNYTDSEFLLPYRLMEMKPFVKTDCDLHRVCLSTSGQPVDGILGEVRYFGDVTRYLPYIDLGTQLHLGKKTTRGCGEYTFEI